MGEILFLVVVLCLRNGGNDSSDVIHDDQRNLHTGICHLVIYGYFSSGMMIIHLHVQIYMPCTILDTLD